MADHESTSSPLPFQAVTPARQIVARAIVLNNGMAVVVDEDDFAAVSLYHWHAHQRPQSPGKFYARGTVNGCRIFMHNFLMGRHSEGLQVDHVNGNSLDNRRSNLRWATQSQNRRNIHGGRGRSLYKGVSWAKRQRKWVAVIGVGGRNRHLGYFDQEDDAARAYDVAAKAHFGEFACPNFPEVPDYRA